jgi:hypothetical protein
MGSTPIIPAERFTCFGPALRTVYNAPFNVVLDDPTAGGGSTDFG